jgi:hypothetical protein
MLIAATAVIMVGWFTGFREIVRGAVVSVAVFALLPFAIITAGIGLALLLLWISLILSLLSHGGDVVISGVGEEAIVESGVRMIPGYYRWLATRRHPVFWGVPLGLVLGALTLSWMLALVDVPKEENTAQSLAEVHALIERFYNEKGSYPKPTEAGQLTWAALGQPEKGMLVLDGFARPLEYRVGGAWKVATYRIRSFGYDGRPGGGDDLCASGGTALGKLASGVKVDKEGKGKWSIKAKWAQIREMRCEE